MKRDRKALLLGGAVWVIAVWGIQAADQIYELDPLLVTAERTVTEDLKTPSAVTVLTREQLMQTGATGLQEALKFTTGIIIHAQGPRNISQGTMSNKVVIRGVEKGTLVLIDGVPINQSGRYNLEDIPVETVERVEIVRGGGAVLYGSEAAGGVINIITRGTRENMVKTGWGNYGIQNHAVSAQLGKLGITYTYDHTGKIDHISAPTSSNSYKYFNIIRGEHNNFNWRYNFNGHLYFTHIYGQNSDHYRYQFASNDKVYKNELHGTKENLAQLHYEEGNIKASLFYNRREQETRSLASSYSKTAYTDESRGIDIANRWNFGLHSAMLGFNFQRDTMDKSVTGVPGKNYERDMYSFYGQMAYALNKKTEADLNLRETWTGSETAGNNYSKFTPEITLMHMLDSHTSIYAKAGKSFMMPTFSQLYGSGNIVPNPGLKPQHGVHYEAGWKKNIGNQSWRLAVYHYLIKDSIDANTTNYPTITYTNEDIRNTGAELTWTVQRSENFSFYTGISYSHPEKQEIDKKGVKGQWHDYYGKIQYNVGSVWKSGKLTTAANLSFLGKRIRDAAPYKSFKPQLFTDINLSYAPNREGRFFLNVDNILDRQDIISTSSSTFYSLGRNFMAGYEYKF